MITKIILVELSKDKIETLSSPSIQITCSLTCGPEQCYNDSKLQQKCQKNEEENMAPIIHNSYSEDSTSTKYIKCFYSEAKPQHDRIV